MVRVEVQVNRRGEVTSVEILEGNRLLGKAAESAAEHWLFAASEDSSGVRTAKLTFEFKLVPDESPAADTLPVFMPPYKVEVKSKIPVVIDSPNIDPPLGRKRMKPGRRNR
jgi:TonB family protein